MTEERYRENIEKKLEKAFDKQKNSIAGFFVRNFRFTYLIVLVIIVLGIISYFALPKEADPEIKIPYAVVNTAYPGASPVDVEELVTDKIEAEIKNLDNLKQFDSSSGQGFSSVFVEFYAEADIEASIADLKDAVDKSKQELPDEATDPVVSEVSFTDVPIVTYALSGNYSDKELKEIAKILEEELETVKNVSKVEVVGGIEREFHIIADQVKLVNYGIGLEQIKAAISRANISLPAGDIKIDDYKYNIRVAGKFERIEDLDSVVVATYESSPIFLSDVALIKDSFKEKRSISRLAVSGQEAENAISLQVHKRTGGNIIKIVKAADKIVDQAVSSERLPKDISIRKLNDYSEFINRDLSTLGTSALQTFILINIILLLILSFRGALVTALSVPIAFLMTFIFLFIQGMTLNGMVLFSLVLSLGLMVDNAIIIMEGIDEYVKQHKKTIYQAAILSVWNFKWPIISGTMTTVCAFVPMFLVSGIMGEYVSILPKTIIVTLLSSLFTAIIIIPTLATRFIKKVSANGNNGRKRFCFVSQVNMLKGIYERLLRKILSNKKRRRKLIASFWIAFILAIAIPASGLMKIEMFGVIDFDYFYINTKLPAGSTLEASDEATKMIEEVVAKVPELDNYVVSVGSNMNIMEGSSGLHKSNLIVNLVEAKNRNRKSYEIAEELRKELSKIQGVEITVDELTAGPPSGAPIEVRVFGDDLKTMTGSAERIKEYFKKIPGVINVRLSTEDSAGEFVFNIDKTKADFFGLSVASIASTLRNAIYGTEATSVNVRGEDIDIIIKYNQENFNDPKDLKNILIFGPRGAVPLSQVAEVDLEPSLLSIGHRDGDKLIRVTADIEAGANLPKIMKDFEQDQDKLDISPDLRLSVGGEVEDIEKSYKEIFTSMILAVFLIAGILILQFNSFKQPLIIIFALPLSIIGVIIGLNITGQAFSFLAFIGIVALAGIVVNDAIVLIDRINKNIEDEMDFEEAIINGGLSRMQPIFLTSLTTVAGIFPLIFADEMWRGFSITVISGLVFSTMLTLVVMPVMYYGICREKAEISDK
ncbi:MMPL family transporter [Candidatus Falkowbacteria bacterium]|nr:MMPL family transporter [Candidatus Falkowbacteria bacterium]